MIYLMSAYQDETKPPIDPVRLEPTEKAYFQGNQFHPGYRLPVTETAPYGEIVPNSMLDQEYLLCAMYEGCQWQGEIDGIDWWLWFGTQESISHWMSMYRSKIRQGQWLEEYASYVEKRIWKIGWPEIENTPTLP